MVRFSFIMICSYLSFLMGCYRSDYCHYCICEYHHHVVWIRILSWPFYLFIYVSIHWIMSMAAFDTCLKGLNDPYTIHSKARSLPGSLNSLDMAVTCFAEAATWPSRFVKTRRSQFCWLFSPCVDCSTCLFWLVTTPTLVGINLLLGCNRRPHSWLVSTCFNLN